MSIPIDGSAIAGSLTADERARGARFRQAIDRARFSQARGLLRTLLGHYLGEPPSAVRLRNGPAGKPMLDGARETLHFNVSHAGDWAVVALARDREVGVDVEQERPMSDLSALAQRFFARAEAAALHALHPATREAAFFRIWTRKEAYVKATGQGIVDGLDRFVVSHGEEPGVTLQLVESPGRDPGWTIRALDMPPGYAAAVAFDGAACPVHTWEWG